MYSLQDNENLHDKNISGRTQIIQTIVIVTALLILTLCLFIPKISIYFVVTFLCILIHYGYKTKLPDKVKLAIQPLKNFMTLLFTVFGLMFILMVFMKYFFSLTQPF